MPIDLLDHREEEAAIAYNKKRGYRKDLITRFQKLVHADPSGDWNTETVEAVARWQLEEGYEADGKVGPTTKQAMTQAFAEEVRPLTLKDKDVIIGYTVEHEGGSDSPYSACNRDGEWRGLFDRPKRDKDGRKIPPTMRHKHPGFKPHSRSRYHPSGGSHVGLSWGAWQATQDGGTLGKVLQYAYNKDAMTFCKVMGGERAAKELLEVTSRKGDAMDENKRSPRVQPVDGADLWESPWLERFKVAGGFYIFQEAQRSAITGRLNKILSPEAEFNVWDYNLTKQGEIAVLFDIAVQFGSGGLRKRWRRAVEKAGNNLTIHHIINELPESKRDRRRAILRSADSWVRYVREKA